MKIEKNIQKIVIIYLLILILNPFILQFFSISSPNSTKKENVKKLPKLSAGEITIITPENTTYNQIMDGYYPATYGFEEDKVGTTGTKISFVDNIGTNGYAEIVNEKDGHKKVLNYSLLADYEQIVNNFNQRVMGTIEFWIYYENTKATEIYMITGGGKLYLSPKDGILRVYDGTWHNFGSYSIKTWYHYAITWDCALGKWDLEIDDKFIRTFNFDGNPLYFNQIRFDGINGANFYLDAIGYSWDPDYKIESNRYEGLVVSFNNSTNLDWIGYSIDNNNNITISGNTTISIPNKGLHSVQVFGNDSFGTRYQSEKRFFTIDPLPLSIITPENKTYNQIMDGYYPATYGFEEDKIGASGTEINFVHYISTNGHAKIAYEKEKHKRVLNFSFSEDYQAISNFFKGQKKGVVEYWIYYTSTQVSTVELKNSYGERLYFDAYQGSLRVYDGSFHYIGTYSTNIWYHYAIEWDCSIGKWNLTINGENIGTFNFEGTPSYLNYIIFNGRTGANYYLDAIGYSWDPKYELESNLNEGFLLGLENDFSFSHIEYSFDDGELFKILGNTSIPIQEDGLHSIKIFARDNESNFYESTKRFFTIDIGPFVKWESPNNGAEVTLPPGDPIFNLQFSYRKLSEITLKINNTDFGSVWNKSCITLNPYTEDIDGYVNATLLGYEEGNPDPITSDTIFIKMAKLTSEVVELLDYDTEFLGQQLYMIIHDPNGDNSFSGFAEETGLSIGIGVSVETGLGLEVGVGNMDESIGASGKFEFIYSTSYDMSLVITDKTELTSSLESNDKMYIGPGRGDTYWGESWVFSWKLRAFYRTYFNGTVRYEEPRIDYTIIRSAETLLNDYNAPSEWKNLNPNHNNWTNVDWDSGGAISVDGGISYGYTHEVEKSEKRRQEVEINIGAEVGGKIGFVSLKASFYVDIQSYQESEIKSKYTTSFTINDDESTDHISMFYGIDKTFGTPIFKTVPIVCKTSNPLEYETYDYVPPVIQFPEIDYDSSNDGLFPCMDDSPLVNVELSDEGGIQAAGINYSIDCGTEWVFITLFEQIANPGTWQGSIPSQTHGTKVLWYLVAWDNEGSKTSRKDPNGNSYSYVVQNRKPIISIISPNGGEIFSNNVIIQWSGVDPDGDTLKYSLAYNNGGIGWHLIISDINETSYVWNIRNYPYSDSILIKVIAYDGYGAISEDVSDFLFTIGQPTDPETSIPTELVFMITTLGVNSVLIGVAVLLISKKIKR